MKKKVIILTMLTGITVLGLAGCKSTTSMKYKSSVNKESSFTINTGSSELSGSGNASSIYNDYTDMWDITGKFTYSEDSSRSLSGETYHYGSFKMQTGIYKNQQFNYTFFENADSFKIMGKYYIP